MRAPPRPGTTLLELIAACCVLGVLLAIGIPPLRHQIDTIAVRAARGEIAAAVARTRIIAVARGGAELVIDGPRTLLWIQDAQARPVRPARDLGDEFRVQIYVEGASRIATLSYDALGLGRLSNRTIRIRRNSAEASVVVSAYGRVRS